MGTPSSSSSCWPTRSPRSETTSADRRARAAGLDSEMNLDRWDDSAKNHYGHSLWNELCSQRFVESGHNAVIVGPVGVGKTFPRDRPGTPPWRRFTVHFERCDLLLRPLRARRLALTIRAIDSEKGTGRITPSSGPAGSARHRRGPRAEGRRPRWNGTRRERGDPVVLRVDSRTETDAIADRGRGRCTRRRRRQGVSRPSRMVREMSASWSICSGVRRSRNRCRTPAVGGYRCFSRRGPRG